MDWLWTRYTVAIYYADPVGAGLYSMAIVVAGAFVTLSFVKDRRYVLFAALGAFLGTYLAVG